MQSNVKNISVQVIIDPIINTDDYENDFPIFEEEIRMTTTIPSNVLVKDIPKVIMNHFDLQHLLPTSEVFFLCPQSKNYISLIDLNDVLTSIGMLAQISNDICYFKVSVSGTLEDFSGIVGRNAIYRNLAKYFVKIFSSTKNSTNIPVIDNAIESIKNSSFIKIPNDNLYEINNAIEKEMNKVNINEKNVLGQLSNLNKVTNLSFSEDSKLENDARFGIQSFSTPNIDQKLSKDYDILSIISPPPKRVKNNNGPVLPKHPTLITATHWKRKITYDKEKEIPQLEYWYTINKNPKHEEMIVYAEELNKISRRTRGSEISISNIKTWFRNRRSKETKERSNSSIL